MNQFRFPIFPVAFVLVAAVLSVQSCGGTDYKSQRNLVVKVSDAHDANLAAAEKIVGEINVEELRAQIRAAFPEVTDEHLKDLQIKSTVLTIDDKPNAMIQASLSFSDTAVPANEIMDFVQVLFEKKLAEYKL